MLTDSPPGIAASRCTTSRWNSCARSGGYFIKRGLSRISATWDASRLDPLTARLALVARSAATATSPTAIADCAPSSHRPDRQRPVDDRAAIRPPLTQLKAGKALNRQPAAIEAASAASTIAGVKLKSKYRGCPSPSTA